MKRVVNKDELKVYWQLGTWYEKTFYVVGLVFTIVGALSFLVGFIDGLLS
jgi:hypothetical protein